MSLEPWIETHSGKRMYFLNPTPDMVDISDIAHSLSLQCRFSGHTSKFYSVAEHSIRVAAGLAMRREPRALILQGLLHDASEAYLLDIPSPIKQHLSNYKLLEEGIMRVIMQKCNCMWPMAPEIKIMDAVMLKNEARQLLPSRGASWINEYPTPFEDYELAWCLPPEQAKTIFLSWFNIYSYSDINDTMMYPT